MNNIEVDVEVYNRSVTTNLTLTTDQVYDLVSRLMIELQNYKDHNSNMPAASFRDQNGNRINFIINNS